MGLRRVEGLDSAFLASETPEWHFHVSAVQIIDPRGTPAFGFDAFREVCRQRIHLVSQFRWRLVAPPFGLGWSYFVDDPQFNVDDHLHRVALASPGDRYQLGRLVGDLLGHKIDRQRALWEVWFIDGLEDGRVAVFTKTHHAILDGVSGVDVASTLYDHPTDATDQHDQPRYEPLRVPSAIEISARNAISFLNVPLRAARLGRDLIEQGVASLPLVLGAHPPSLPFQAPRTPFNGQLTPRRGFAAASLPLDTVLRLKRIADVTFNDVVLAVCAGALRTFLDDRHQLPERPLVAQVPVSTRTDVSRTEVGTQVGSMFVSLATHLDDPMDRLRSIHESSTAGKILRRTLVQHRTISLTEALPPPVFNVAAHLWSMAQLDARTPPVYNTIISNIAGPSGGFSVAGAPVEATYPMGPLLYGGALNITMVSHRSRLDVGLITCPDLLPDAWALADAFGPALEELAAAVVGPTLETAASAP
jgi:WS/DGAT/MGAT family acyltransferase